MLEKIYQVRALEPNPIKFGMVLILNLKYLLIVVVDGNGIMERVDKNRSCTSIQAHSAYVKTVCVEDVWIRAWGGGRGEICVKSGEWITRRREKQKTAIGAQEVVWLKSCHCTYSLLVQILHVQTSEFEQLLASSSTEISILSSKCGPARGLLQTIVGSQRSNPKVAPEPRGLLLTTRATERLVAV